MYSRIFWVLILWGSCLLPVRGIAAFRILGDEPVRIPFRMVNNLIVIDVNINGTDLSFLLDSGVAESLIFSLDNKEVDLKNTQTMQFSGLGSNATVEGIASHGNTIRIGEKYVDSSHKIYIILNESFDFSAHIGTPINGIIGYEFFKDYPVEINYMRNNITIYRDTRQLSGSKLRKYQMLPITFDRGKPYVQIDLHTAQHQYRNAKMLIDLGNSDALWVFEQTLPGFTFQSKVMEDHLGRGFSGDIQGKRGRIRGMQMGKYHFEKILIAMPDTQSLRFTHPVSRRIGSIGSEILSRFHVILDYPHQVFYFRANKYLDKPFRMNMSGLDIVYDGTQWYEEVVGYLTEIPYGQRPENAGTVVFKSPSHLKYELKEKPAYTIHNVRKNSPAALAGVQKGDKVKSINGKVTGKLTMNQIYQILSKEEGEKIDIVLLREGHEISTSFVLEDPIAYLE